MTKLEEGRFKIPKQEFTAEFKELAVKRVKAGQSVGMVARELGLFEQTLRNWVKAADRGQLNPPGAKLITAEQMERSRLGNEFTLRFNRRRSSARGLLFHRLAQQAASVDTAP